MLFAHHRIGLKTTLLLALATTAALATAQNFYTRAGSGASITFTGDVTYHTGGNTGQITDGSSASYTETFSRVSASGNRTATVETEFHADYGVLRGFGSIDLHKDAFTSGSVNANFGQGIGGSNTTDFLDRFSIGGVAAGTTVTVRFSHMVHHNAAITGTTSQIIESRIRTAVFTDGFSLIDIRELFTRDLGDQTLMETFDVDLVAGTNYRFSSLLNVEGLMILSEGGDVNLTVDALSTGRVGIELLNSNATLNTESGATYAPVPEPTTLTLLSLTALAIKRRKRN